MSTSNETHSVPVGYILWIFGFTGSHRFYYGKPITGALWFFTGGLLLIGWIIDVFLTRWSDNDRVIRLGLCCIFRDAPIKFRTATATAIKRLSPDEGRKKLADLCAENAAALMSALRYCSEHGIGCFRMNSQILPLKTHPEVGYGVRELPGGRQIVKQFQ